MQKCAVVGGLGWPLGVDATNQSVLGGAGMEKALQEEAPVSPQSREGPG